MTKHGKARPAKFLRRIQRSPIYDAVEATVVLDATLTCPECGFEKTETMPTNVCQFFYTCSSCGATLTPRSGDCCIFCSYSDQTCPTKQTGDA